MKKQAPEVSENILNATIEALTVARSAWASRLQSAINEAAYKPSSDKIGTTIYGKYPVNITPEQIDEIVNDLSDLQSKVGGIARFRELALNYLIVEWTKLAFFLGDRDISSRDARPPAN